VVQQAPLVMLDEPFTGIDEATSRELMELILEMHQQGQTILAVLHDNQRVAATSRKRCAGHRSARWGATDDLCSQRRRGCMIWHLFFQPFIEFGFMRRALVVCLALSSAPPCLASSLAAAHEPDGRCAVARHFTRRGGGLSAERHVAAGHEYRRFYRRHCVALVAGWVSRRTPLKEDASFAGFYLGSLALGVTLVSLRGSSVDLLHLLFGSILAVDNDAALFVSGRRQPDADLHRAVLSRAGQRSLRQPGCR
jgi:hypothetical protein